MDDDASIHASIHSERMEERQETLNQIPVEEVVKRLRIENMALNQMLAGLRAENASLLSMVADARGDRNFQIRDRALDLALDYAAKCRPIDKAVVEQAREFESYLRGGGDVA